MKIQNNLTPLQNKILSDSPFCLINTFFTWYLYLSSKLLRSFQLLRLSQPFMEKYLKIQDTCGIHNLHAMPGVIGGIVGAITAAAATESVYGKEG